MIELILQDSFAEWVIPLTLVIMWIFSLVIISLCHPVRAQKQYHYSSKDYLFNIPIVSDGLAPGIGLLLIKTVRRKVCPDDTEGHVHLLFK
ncbi:hypothetical protein D4T97_000325 [Siminovitchia acidinfaciens]|uniref:Uncharacterized protein n=1 Tax=Siminovitchia acidinfaciens TaxID=2321395 RepID=A0A429Y6A4_9BACI|nr:hypothetical protein [Siminovitchia acidinfaciens]RST76987.1 hypothetical protein D4T97_000325 [Siminovitchia acidinfaciens]